MKAIYLVLLLALGAVSASAGELEPFRPPATPLIVHDPYFSIWSLNDKLTDSAPRHWTAARNEIASMIRVDGKTYRIMSDDPRWRPTGVDIPPLEQKSLEVLPTRTLYAFEGAGIRVELTFLTPALPEDLDILARPASYVIWSVVATDGATHDVQLYFHAAANIARDNDTQPVAWSRFHIDGEPVLRIGSRDQAVLRSRGDNLRIDWGYLYLAPQRGVEVDLAALDRLDAWSAFRATGSLPGTDELEPDLWPGRPRMQVLVAALPLGRVATAPVSRRVVVAYDDIYSVEYMERRQRPYWRRNGTTAADMLRAALADYEPLAERCGRFDEGLMADLRAEGGEEYARITALAYRQAIGAHKITLAEGGRAFMMSKENASNGSIGTVDVMYPASPVFLLLNTELMKANMRPLLDYAAMERWPFPFAPHDVGQYPLANGQMYGGGEKSEDRQMPVEESANMILMAAAIARADGEASFAEEYWALLSQWADYLKRKGFDPEFQLSTDDFTGRLAHNTNLSLKAIVALGAYSQLCEATGRADEARDYRAQAEEFASRWVKEADDGEHFRLTFDKSGAWSQKYNLVWDRILDLKLFPPQVARKEVAYYKKVQNKYGLPLDSRSKFTKLDWIFWSATLSDTRQDFEALVKPAYRFAHETPDRYPLSDWYWTHDAKRRGFSARSVVGGLYIKLLTDEAVWQKWARRAREARQ